MALDNVVKEILEQAEGQSASIVDEGKADAKTLLQNAKAKAQEETSAYNTETAKLAAEMKKMELSSLGLRLNKEYLNAKKAIIDEIYQTAEKKISKRPIREKEKVLKKLVARAEKELRSAKYYYSNSKDKAVIKKLFSKLKFKKTIDTLGGVILEDEDETVRVNYTFGVILNNVKEANLNDISKRTFG